MKTYVIRLKNSEISSNLAKDAFESAQKFGLDVEYFDAIDGKSADNFISTNGLTVADSILNRHAGTRGCFCSHFCLWKIAENSTNPILVLEHDGVVIRDILPIVDMVDEICHLDPCNIFDPVYESEIAVQKEIGVREYYKEIRSNTIPSWAGEEPSEHFRGTYGYVLTQTGAKKLVKYWKNNPIFPSDVSISKKVLKLQITKSTHVRLHNFYKNSEIIRKVSTRKNYTI